MTMSTENEMWRNEYEEGNDASRDGNRNFNRDNNYNRREEGNYRPAYNKYNSDRPNRPSYNREGGERPRFNRDNGDRRPRFNQGERPERPRRSYNQDGGGYERNYNRDNNEQRPYRPSYNRERNYNREDKPWRNNSGEGDDRPRFRRPVPNSGNSYNQEGSDGKPRRPRISSGEGNYNRGGYSGGGNYRGGGNRQQGFSRPRPRTSDYNPNAKYSLKKQIEYKELNVDPDEPIRLNKFLANAGVCSRREADEFITAGVVSVNGEIVTELGTKIKRSDLVKFHDEPVSAERKVYIILNKPKNCVTTSDDPKERHTVMDLVKNACRERIYPVGRLDRNTTGVLLLTNDGDLASKLTHPQFMKKKIYHVHLDKNVTKSDMDQIASGINLEDGEIHADAISYASDVDKKQVGIEIHSGKNRIVRRIFESFGYKVLKLDRVYFAGLTKKKLRRGDWRFLTEQEVNFLRMGSFE